MERDFKAVLDSGSHFMVPDSGCWIPFLSRIPDSLSYILDSKARDSGLNEQNFPGFQNLQVKIFSDSGIRIPLHGRIQGRGPGGPPSLFPLFLDQTEARRAEKKFFWDRPPYLRVWMTAPLLIWRSASACDHPWSTHIFQFSLSVKNRRYIRVLLMFKLFLAKKPQVNLHGNLKRQTGNGILV